MVISVSILFLDINKVTGVEDANCNNYSTDVQNSTKELTTNIDGT